MRILLIAGGWSSEREVSLKGARTVEQSLLRLGHEVTFYDPACPVLPEDVEDSGPLSGPLEHAAEHDFAFINLHGCPGEDGLVQSMLDAVGCPYQGSGARASFLALHKAASKSVFRKYNLATPDWEYLVSHPGHNWHTDLPYPLFVKSNNGGSSLHLYRVDSPEILMPVLDGLFSSGLEVLIEPLIVGQEITCAVLGDEALPPILVEPRKGEFFNYESKYARDGANEICPAPISPELTAKIQQDALTAHRALGLEGYSRADFILTEDGTAYLLEVNTLPGMTVTSLVPQAAAAIGLDFDQYLARLIELGLKAAGKPCEN
ncbi:MAG: D-alanine--D-alanine ligase [Desulfovibrionaceae bacterium]|nr:D-alanine--D-alanine ligase [Desulfovibrionaceae bacterium]